MCSLFIVGFELDTKKSQFIFNNKFLCDSYMSRSPFDYGWEVDQVAEMAYVSVKESADMLYDRS